MRSLICARHVGQISTFAAHPRQMPLCLHGRSTQSATAPAQTWHGCAIGSIVNRTWPATVLWRGGGGGGGGLRHSPRLPRVAYAAQR